MAPGLSRLDLVDGQLVVESGVSGAKLAKFCRQVGLGASAYWATIPGSVGGFLAMNAGAFGYETWDHVVKVDTMSLTGERRWRQAGEFSVGYRSIKCLESVKFL